MTFESSLFLPYAVSAGLVPVGILVTGWGERKAVAKVLKTRDEEAQLAADTYGLTADDYLWEDAKPVYSATINWMAEVGGTFSGYVALNAANYLAIESAGNSSWVVPTCGVSFIVGLVLLLGLVFRGPGDELPKLKFAVAPRWVRENVNYYHVMLILLNLLAGTVIALAGEAKA